MSDTDKNGYTKFDPQERIDLEKLHETLIKVDKLLRELHASGAEKSLTFPCKRLLDFVDIFACEVRFEVRQRIYSYQAYDQYLPLDYRMNLAKGYEQ